MFVMQRSIADLLIEANTLLRAQGVPHPTIRELTVRANTEYLSRAEVLDIIGEYVVLLDRDTHALDSDTILS